MTRIDINEKILSKNDMAADRLRKRFKETGTAVINIASAPGSGKTTLLEKILPQLKTRYRLAVIEGDLRTENDANRLRALGVNAVQIQTGDACHLEAVQIEKLLDDLQTDNLDLLIIENIGNLVCPASYDLGEDAMFVMLSVAEGDDKPAKYPTIFHNAGYFILNKTDLAPYTDFDIQKCLNNALSVNSKLKLFTLSARTGEGINKLIEAIEGIIKNKKEGGVLK
ncbi:MAG: hydrogenase nickel incorporation protein HypB [Deferribacteraceae bacterium]|jgi:hydrogenase nickel incorporation protein HypB|nr:hydrogenase nickel incorporation protein HypB [Deferribacteraceae bacterium]